jgi:two-component system, cell cycle response regulator PopA
MTGRPQILVLGGHDAAEAVAAAGFALAGDDAVRRQTGAAIIDARGGAALRAHGLMASLRSALGPRSGLYFAWTEPGQVFEAEGFDGVFTSDIPPAFLGARLESALRIAVMTDEALLRFRTLAGFGGVARPPALQLETSPRILVFGQPSATALSVTAQLEEQGATTVAAFSSFTAFDYLHEGGFDGVAVVAGDDAVLAGSFCSALRRNSRLFHMPCLVLAGRDFGEIGPLLGRGASDAVVAGVDDAAAVLRLMGLVDEKRRRDALSLAFSAARAPKALDPGTGLYNRAFFEAHLAALARRADETDRPLAVAALRFGPLVADPGRVPARVINRVAGQAGSMLGRLVRAEDVAACLGSTDFTVAFPASDEAAALVAAERIAAVLECTAFDSGEGPGAEPLQLRVQLASATLMPGEAGSALIRRALARLPIVRG